MEAGFLGVPCVNIGTRQQGRERTRNVLDVPCDPLPIKEAIVKQIAHGRYKPDYLFGDGNSGERIAGILAIADTKIQKKFNDISTNLQTGYFKRGGLASRETPFL